MISGLHKVSWLGRNGQYIKARGNIAEWGVTEGKIKHFLEFPNLIS